MIEFKARLVLRRYPTLFPFFLIPSLRPLFLTPAVAAAAAAKARAAAAAAENASVVKTIARVCDPSSLLLPLFYFLSFGLQVSKAGPTVLERQKERERAITPSGAVTFAKIALVSPARKRREIKVSLFCAH